MTHSHQPFAPHTSCDRRAFLIASAVVLGAAFWPRSLFGAVAEAPKFSAYPFQLGVASGDPSSDGMVLWTRLAPQPLIGGGMPRDNVAVTWRIADDEAMTKIVREGSSIASPELAHSVHVEVSGLAPDRWYWYQFQVGSELSPKGRTRTLPAADALVDTLRISVASCHNYEKGLYTAYEHMLKEQCDLVFFVGDYIYEHAIKKDGNVRPVDASPICMTLDQYRTRYALYKTDPALQAMHAAAPWIVTPDDHEVVNNYAADLPPENIPRTSHDQFLQRRAGAYQAYYEHLPFRLRSLPQGPNMSLYRRFSYGRLADFFVLDTRQYRTNQPLGDGNKAPNPVLLDPQGTMLGSAQRNWLQQGLLQSSALWNVLAQQVLFAPIDFSDKKSILYGMDSWTGYEYERRQLIQFLQKNKTSNPIILSGDAHVNWACNILADYDGGNKNVVAAEFLGTSISSFGDGMNVPKNSAVLLQKNPFVKFYNAERGYLMCTINQRQWRTDYRTVPYVSKPGAPLQTRASFIVEAGKPGIQAL